MCNLSIPSVACLLDMSLSAPTAPERRSDRQYLGNTKVLTYDGEQWKSAKILDHDEGKSVLRTEIPASTKRYTDLRKQPRTHIQFHAHIHKHAMTLTPNHTQYTNRNTHACRHLD